MKIVDVDYLNAVGDRIIYTVEIAKDLFVDVMYVGAGDLCYVMQNADGSCVYNSCGAVKNCICDETAIVKYVRKYHKSNKRKR